jgi:hypothetical protein
VQALLKEVSCVFCLDAFAADDGTLEVQARACGHRWCDYCSRKTALLDKYERQPNYGAADVRAVLEQDVEGLLMTDWDPSACSLCFFLPVHY